MIITRTENIQENPIIKKIKVKIHKIIIHNKGKTALFNLLLIGFLLMVFQNWAQVNQIPKSNKCKEVQFPAAQFANSQIIYQIILVANKTWCYDIIAICSAVLKFL